jgi:hypothetical protein
VCSKMGAAPFPLWPGQSEEHLLQKAIGSRHSSGKPAYRPRCILLVGDRRLELPLARFRSEGLIVRRIPNRSAQLRYTHHHGYP